MNEKEKQVLKSLNELVHKCINKKELETNLAEKANEVNGKLHSLIRFLDLSEQKYYKYIFAFEFENTNAITGTICFLKKRMKDNIYITEISID